MKRYTYYRDCVSWPREDVHETGGLCDMIASANTITRRTFLKHVSKADMKQLEDVFGYDRTLPMARDWHVSYHRSKLHGKRCYFFKHSAIEYVFV
jgi:hypothetical protein